MSFGRLERPQAAPPMSEINMTPLIDVMLVLLVIFLVTAPLLASRLAMDLPRSDVASSASTPDFVLVAIDAQGQRYLGDELITREALSGRLKALGQGRPGLEVQLRADRAVPYGEVAELIGVLQQSGLSRIGFVMDRPTPP